MQILCDENPLCRNECFRLMESFIFPCVNLAIRIQLSSIIGSLFLHHLLRTHKNHLAKLQSLTVDPASSVEIALTRPLRIGNFCGRPKLCHFCRAALCLQKILRVYVSIARTLKRPSFIVGEPEQKFQDLCEKTSMIRSPAFGGINLSRDSLERRGPASFQQQEHTITNHFHQPQPLSVIEEDAYDSSLASPSGQLKKQRAIHCLSSMAPRNNNETMDLPMELDEDGMYGNSQDSNKECESDGDDDWGFFENLIAPENHSASPAFVSPHCWSSMMRQRPPSSTTFKRRRTKIKFSRGRCSQHPHPYGSATFSSDLCFR